MDKYAKEFARAIDASGVSSADLAHAIGVDPSYISQWKTGRRPIPADKARAVAARIHADPAAISKSYESLLPTLTPASEGHSQLVRLDPLMIAETHHALQRRYAKVGGYKIEEHPEIFVTAYKIRIGISDASVPQNVVDLVIEHADLAPQGADTDGRSDGVPLAGTAERRTRAGGGGKA